MRVLITGAGGFIGSHLVDSQLEQGNFVRGVDLHLERLDHTIGHPNVEVIQGDITDKRLVRDLTDGVDVVYHLASAHLDVSLDDKHYRRVNVEATLDLIDAARCSGVGRFVHCSSVGVIGDVDQPPADETSPCKPVNIYERTKLEGEIAALNFSKQNNFPLVVARPAWVYGPRCPRTEKLIRTIAKGMFPIFGSGHNLRHPVYIHDAVRGLELCAQAERSCGEVYIIAGSEAVKVLDLVTLISEQLGVRVPKLHLPLAVGLGGGLALELLFKPLNRQPPFSRRSVDFFLKNNVYSIDKARIDLGYEPSVDLASGFYETIQFLT
jgi:dihydroflavonol-4-reductase